MKIPEKMTPLKIPAPPAILDLQRSMSPKTLTDSWRYEVNRINKINSQRLRRAMLRIKLCDYLRGAGSVFSFESKSNNLLDPLFGIKHFSWCPASHWISIVPQFLEDGI